MTWLHDCSGILEQLIRRESHNCKKKVVRDIPMIFTVLEKSLKIIDKFLTSLWSVSLSTAPYCKVVLKSDVSITILSIYMVASTLTELFVHYSCINNLSDFLMTGRFMVLQ